MQLDDEIRADLIDSFNDFFAQIEHLLEHLCEDQEQDLNALFRIVHTIKGNAAMVQMKNIVDFTHSIEEVVGALRNAKLAPTLLISEVLQLGMDRLRDLHYRDLLKQDFDNLLEMELQGLFRLIAQSNDKDAEQYCQQVLDLLSGEVDIVNQEKLIEESHSPPENACANNKVDDLIFFKALACQIDKQSQFWVGRSEQLHDWAQKVNVLMGQPIDIMQLSAATYLHDLGMCLVPNQVLEKEAKLDDKETEQIRQHPLWICEFLKRMDGWQEAAQVVLEHHERIDGRGYPNGKRGDEIHTGAKIIAVIDAFFSITNGRADRARRKSVVRAISEINARIGTQFDEACVAKFNEMIKNELKSGAL